MKTIRKLQFYLSSAWDRTFLSLILELLQYFQLWKGDGQGFSTLKPLRREQCLHQKKPELSQLPLPMDPQQYLCHSLLLEEIPSRDWKKYAEPMTISENIRLHWCRWVSPFTEKVCVITDMHKDFATLLKASGESVIALSIRRLVIPKRVFYCMFQSVLIALSSVALNLEDFHNFLN